MTGQQSDTLTAKLQARQREQLDAVAALTQSELQRLANSLKQQCSAVASTTSSDIERLSSEINSTIEALHTTMRQARNTAESCQLSHLEQERLKQALTDQLKAVHSEAIGGQLTPLRRELQAINREARALSKTTAKAWLKPLLIGGCAGLGVIVAAVVGTLTLDQVIGNRVAALSELNRQIEQAQATASRLPVNAQVVTIEGRRYLVSPTLGPVQGLTDGRKAVLLED